MGGDLEEILAKQAITEALYRYCVAVDRIDEDTWWQTWDRDAVAHYEEIFDGSAAGLMTFIFDAHRACDATSHQVTNEIIDVDGDRASSESYVTAVIRSGANDIVARGRYQDRWTRRDEGWRIEERRFQSDVMQIIPVGGYQG